MNYTRDWIGNEDVPKREILWMREGKRREDGPVIIEEILENELLDEGVSQLETDLKKRRGELDIVAFYELANGIERKPFIACLKMILGMDPCRNWD